MENVIKIRRQLIENSTGHRMDIHKRFFKEEIKPHGVPAPVAVKIGKEAFKEIKKLPKEKIFVLCEELWKDGYFEECIIACNWSYYIHKQYQSADFKVFDKWVSADAVAFENANAASTSITMLNKDTAVEATFKDAPPPAKYIFSTKYEQNTCNWLKFFLLFGWVWMWFFPPV